MFCLFVLTPTYLLTYSTYSTYLLTHHLHLHPSLLPLTSPSFHFHSTKKVFFLLCYSFLLSSFSLHFFSLFPSLIFFFFLPFSSSFPSSLFFILTEARGEKRERKVLHCNLTLPYSWSCLYSKLMLIPRFSFF